MSISLNISLTVLVPIGFALRKFQSPSESVDRQFGTAVIPARARIRSVQIEPNVRRMQTSDAVY